MQTEFEKQTFSQRLKSMCKVDFKRMFSMSLVYVAAGISLLLPILILVMTTMTGVPADPATGEQTAVQTFTNAWQSLGAVSGAAMGMDLTSMCNINMLYFLAAICTCIFVADDFKSGYAKNLFAVRARKTDYVASKTLVSFVGATILFLCYCVGALIGGAIARLSFDTTGFGAGGIAACLLSKIFLCAVFVSVALLIGTVAKQKLWISVLGSCAAGMLLFTVIPTVAPLNAGIVNAILCLAGGALFAAGLGAVSKIILDKTNLV